MHQTESTREGDSFWGWHRYYTRHISSCSVLLTTPPPPHPTNLIKIRMGMQDARAGNCNFKCLHYHLHKCINANNCQYITWSLRVRATWHGIVFICIELFKSPCGLVTPYGITNLSSSTQARGLLPEWHWATSINTNLLSKGFCDLHLGSISQKGLMNIILKTWWKRTLLRLPPHPHLFSNSNLQEYRHTKIYEVCIGYASVQQYLRHIMSSFDRQYIYVCNKINKTIAFL